MRRDPRATSPPRRRRARTDRARWAEADRAARPARLARLRERLARPGVDAYFGVRREHMRYLTGLELDDGEEKVAGDSGQFLVGGDEVVVLADSRYTIQARERGARTPGSRTSTTTSPSRWPELLGVARGHGASASRRASSAMRPGSGSPRRRRTSSSCRSRAGSRRPRGQGAGRARARRGRLRGRRRALAALLPSIRPGVTEHELALDLEWEMRTGGAEALAFDVACLAGPKAALPHGSPGDRPSRPGRSCCSTSARRSRATAAT